MSFISHPGQFYSYGFSARMFGDIVQGLLRDAIKTQRDFVGNVSYLRAGNKFDSYTCVSLKLATERLQCDPDAGKLQHR